MKAVKSNKNQNSTKKGFTIIEVVLVLAVAGLIFLMIFLALPALQRSQRDTERKQDVAMVVTALHNWKAANRGKGYTTFGNSNITASDPNDEYDKNNNITNSIAPVKNSPLNNYIGFKADNSNKNDSSSSLSINTLIVTTITAHENSIVRLSMEGYGAHQRIAVVIGHGCENMEKLENGDAVLKGLKPGAAVVAFLESGGAYCQEA